MFYHPLHRVDEVLQVDVVSVPLDVCQEELVDPRSDLTLENHHQHCRRQLQEEDQANHTWELITRTTQNISTLKIWCTAGSFQLKMCSRTNFSRQMFSLSAPTQPANPRTKVMPPTARTNQTGSNPWSRVTWVRSTSTPCEPAEKASCSLQQPSQQSGFSWPWWNRFFCFQTTNQIWCSGRVLVTAGKCLWRWLFWRHGYWICGT